MELDIEKIVLKQIEEMDLENMVTHIIKEQITSDVQRTILSVVREKADKMIGDELKVQLSKGIKTDDGWGKKEEYKSFDDLFKKVFRERFEGTWEVKRTIETIVRDKVNDLFKTHTGDVCSKVADLYLKSGIPEIKK